MAKVYPSKINTNLPYRVDKRITYFSPYVPVSQDEQIESRTSAQSGVRLNPDIVWGTPSGS